ncbi:MAG: hypothetical protein HQL96_00005, partial [Magnetococcales bacterium]|nr:hypothetical protein [Magnetococcales bacterium]
MRIPWRVAALRQPAPIGAVAGQQHQARFSQGFTRESRPEILARRPAP